MSVYSTRAHPAADTYTNIDVDDNGGESNDLHTNADANRSGLVFCDTCEVDESAVDTASSDAADLQPITTTGASSRSDTAASSCDVEPRDADPHVCLDEDAVGEWDASSTKGKTKKDKNSTYRRKKRSGHARLSKAGTGHSEQKKMTSSIHKQRLKARDVRFKTEAMRPPPAPPLFWAPGLPTVGAARATLFENKVITSDKVVALHKLIARKQKAGEPLTTDQQRALDSMGSPPR